MKTIILCTVFSLLFLCTSAFSTNSCANFFQNSSFRFPIPGLQRVGIEPQLQLRESLYPPTYKGPKNNFLERMLQTPWHIRTPREHTAATHLKVFSWEDILISLGVNISRNISDRPVVQYFLKNSNPMFLKVKDTSQVTVWEWMLLQYPELRAVYYDSQVISNGGYGAANTVVLEAWLQKHPEYRNGIIVAPLPAIWNRVVLQDSAGNFKNSSERDPYRHISDGLNTAQAIDIMTVAALFNSQLAEKHFLEVQEMLASLAGPYSLQLSQKRVVKTIAQWVLTQYPELQSLAQNPNLILDKDALIHFFGETLTPLPIEWATGSFKTSMPFIARLEEVSKEWEHETLAKIMDFQLNLKTPQLKPNTFELKDPETQARRELKAGDEVFFALKETDPRFQNSTWNRRVEGVVDTVITENGIVVGVELRHFLRKGDSEYSHKREEVLGISEDKVLYWLSDFSVAESRIERKIETDIQSRDISTYTFPEDSGPVRIAYSSTGLEAPISVGDSLLLSLQNAGQDAGLLTGIVKGFERDPVTRLVTALQMYVSPSGFKYFPRNVSFEEILNTPRLRNDLQSPFHIKKLYRDTDGTPLFIESEDAQVPKDEYGRTNLASTYPVLTVPLEFINRLNSATRFNPGRVASKAFQQPQSPKRQRFTMTSQWYPSVDQQTLQVFQDSGEFMLQIGSEQVSTELAPLTARDEVLLTLKNSQKVGGIEIERILITSLIFERGKAIGLKGIPLESFYLEKTWFFKDIILHLSYIITNPHFKHANKIPGGYSKRKPIRLSWWWGRSKSYSATEDVFGYRTHVDATSIAPWTEKPTSFNEWLEDNTLADSLAAKIAWAYWVFKTTKEAHDYAKIFRSLANQFHPDKAKSDEKTAAEVMKILNEAREVLDAVNP